MSRIWKISKGANSFNQDINDWNVSSVTNMSQMSSGATASQPAHLILGCLLSYGMLTFDGGEYPTISGTNISAVMKWSMLRRARSSIRISVIKHYIRHQSLFMFWFVDSLSDVNKGLIRHTFQRTRIDHRTTGSSIPTWLTSSSANLRMLWCNPQFSPWAA